MVKELIGKMFGSGITETEPSQEETDLVKDWIAELDAAKKREKDYRTDAKKCVEIYEAQNAEKYQYNILYSNTETLSPGLYSAVPRPVVQRRYKDEDPLAKEAAKTAQRVLAFLIDSGDPSYASFDALMKSCVLEGLVPGRGVTKFKYDPTFTTPAEGDTAAPTVSYETVCGERVSWDRFYHGYANVWQEVPWVCYIHYMTKAEAKKNFPDTYSLIPENAYNLPSEEDTDNPSANELKVTDKASMTCVYEIWDKETKKVFFLNKSAKKGLLKQVDDPLGLQGFFNCPEPMHFVDKISTLVPIPLYKYYEDQCKELNIITVRIRNLITALKVRGFYDSTVEGMDKVMESEDNTLTPVENVVALYTNGGKMDSAIWLMPIEKLVAVLQQLYTQRMQIKQVIYEITGISDILRGSSVASETATAQNIKNQWGTLRLREMQKEVMRYTRDCLRIMAEIAVSKLSEQTIKSMTGLPYPTTQEKQQAQVELQMMQQQAQTMPQGQPPQQPPQALIDAVNSPSWEAILGLLKDDIHRDYRIDIETNSTVDAAATEDKQDIAEFMNSMAQFMNGISPLVQAGIMPFEAAKGMLLSILRRYSFGPEVEDEIKAMKPPQQQPQPGQQEAQAAAQAAQQKAALDLQTSQAKLQTTQISESAQQKTIEMQMQAATAQHSYDMQELARKAQVAEVEFQARLQKHAVDTANAAKGIVDAHHEALANEAALANQPEPAPVTVPEDTTQQTLMMGQVAQALDSLAKGISAKKRVKGPNGKDYTMEVDAGPSSNEAS